MAISVAAIMLCKDEADIVERAVRHLLANTDEVLVADNLSTDGTLDILHELAAEHPELLVSVDDDPAYYQAKKTTALAHVARQHGHDWVIPCDTDERWETTTGLTLREMLEDELATTVRVKALIYNHVCTGADPADPDPWTRIQWRWAEPLEWRWAKVACRLTPDLRIDQGNHSAATSRAGYETGGLLIHHYPYRSVEHFIRKARNGAAAYQLTTLSEDIGKHWRDYGRILEEEGEEGLAGVFRGQFWVADPEGRDDLVHDPWRV